MSLVPPEASNPDLFAKINAEADALLTQSKLDELQDKLAYYKAKAEQAEAVLRAYREHAGRERELITELTNAVRAFDPYPHVEYNPGQPDKRSAVAFVSKTSDWQIGEVIEPNETEGFGEFNWEIAQKRVAILGAKELDDLTAHRDAGFPIDEIHVFDEGDPVSGNIHYELEVTNEFPAPEAAVNAAMLHAEYVSRLAAHAKHVHVWRITGDNHGRFTRKNQFKQGAINNWAYIVHQINKLALAKHENVTIHHSRGLTLLANVVGKKFLIKHGHTVKAWMGIPFYGLEREAAREARKRMNTDKTYDYMSIGHYHVPAWNPGGLLINGSLPGTTELDHAVGRFARPSQVSFFVHPRHGMFGWTPWNLD